MIKLRTNSKIISKNTVQLISTLFFFLGYYLYLYFIISPSLYAQCQEFEFFFDRQFLLEFLFYPGGILELSASFLSQFYEFALISTFIITFIAIIITIITIKLFKRLYDNQVGKLFYFIPAILLLALHHHYTHEIMTDLGLMVSIFFFYLYLTLLSKKSHVSFLIFLMLYGLLYYLTAGYALVFASLCGLYELLFRHQIVLALLSIFSMIVIPYLTIKTFVVWNIKKAYLFMLPFDQAYYFIAAPYLFLLFFHALLFISVISRHVNWNVKSAIFKISINTTAIILSGLLLFLSSDQKTKITLQIDQCSTLHKWDKLIDLAKKQQSDHIIVTFHTNRALYHQGRLLSDMFSFPQNWWVDGLIIPINIAYEMPLHRCDFWMECGHLNEAQHWAYEAFAIKGETVRNIKRLAEIHMLTNNVHAAEKCFTRLESTLFGRKWAINQRQALINQSVFYTNEEFREINSRKVKADFIVNPMYPESDLENIFQHNPKNKMAFEYLMACYLFMGLNDRLIGHVETLRSLNYSHIPRHFEEALILHMAMNKLDNVNLYGYKFNRNTVQRFHQLQKLINRYWDSPTVFKEKLAEQLADTYWCYYFNSKLVINQSRPKSDETTDMMY